MKPVEVNSSTYIEFDKENNKEDLKFEVSHHAKILNIKIFLEKAMLQIGKIFVIKNVKNIVPWTYLVKFLKGEKIVWTFYE